MEYFGLRFRACDRRSLFREARKECYDEAKSIMALSWRLYYGGRLSDCRQRYQPPPREHWSFGSCLYAAQGHPKLRRRLCCHRRSCTRSDEPIHSFETVSFLLLNHMHHEFSISLNSKPGPLAVQYAGCYTQT